MQELRQWPPPQGRRRAAAQGAARVAAVQCVCARVLRSKAYFILAVTGHDGRRWAVAKRYSHFAIFKKTIAPLLARIAPGTDKMAFPPTTWGSG